MPNNINLHTFAGGAVAERFQLELDKVLDNIADPNTDFKKERSVTVTVKIKSNEKRDIAGVNVVTKSSVAPAKGVETQILMGIDGRGNVVGKELVSGAKDQLFMDTEGDVADDVGNKVNVVDFQKNKTGGNQ